jgi:hypothetical protein
MESNLEPNFIRLAKLLFDTHKKVARFFVTSDGQTFEREGDATYHASKLKEKGLVQIFNPEMSAAEITEFKENENRELSEGRIKAYEKAFPELARMIRANARNPQR